MNEKGAKLRAKIGMNQNFNQIQNLNVSEGFHVIIRESLVFMYM